MTLADKKISLRGEGVKESKTKSAIQGKKKKKVTHREKHQGK